MNEDDLAIKWPAHYAPARAAVHVRNELAMAAPAEVVWAWLVRAPQWPQWYSNSKHVRFVGDAGPTLGAGVRFRWQTFGMRLISEVRECVPEQRLAWDAKAFGLDVYHAWLIVPTATGCTVITEETQHGFVARAGALLFPTRMFRYHQLWLEALARCAMSGLPR